MLDAELASIVREMRDRQQIYDCLMRYCRGIDRFDREVVASVYHPDALDDHGSFVGTAEGFIDWAFALHRAYHRRTQHMITNHSCTIDGDTAHAESYFILRTLNVEAPFHSIFSGRYLDRFEKRDGRWAIAARICTVDVRDQDSDPHGDELDGTHVLTARDPSDPSYMHPIVVDPARFTK